MKKIPKGTMVLVRFLDCCQIFKRGMVSERWDQPVPCTVIGFMIKDTHTHYVLSTWINGNDLNDEDCDAINIPKHPGIKVRRLK